MFVAEQYTGMKGELVSIEDTLDDVEGIGERRAKIINQSLKRLQEQNIIKLYNM